MYLAMLWNCRRILESKKLRRLLRKKLKAEGRESDWKLLTIDGLESALFAFVNHVAYYVVNQNDI